MYDFPYRDKFYHDVKEELILITFTIPNEDPETQEQEPYITIEITSEDMVENFDMQEAIMSSESLNFQNCISSYISFTTKYIQYSLIEVGWINVYKLIYVESQSNWFQIPLGVFKVVEDNISHDGTIQEVVAYDELYNVINCNQESVMALYNDIYNNVYPTNIKNIRDYFFTQFGIEQESIALINDDIVLPRQLSEDDTIDGGTIVKCIAELNGVFPHIGKDGILHWISLDVGDIHETALYPIFYPGYNTFPGRGYAGNYYDIYKDQYKENSTIWANFKTLRPDGVQIRNQDNAIAAYYNSENSENPYIVINNFMCNDLSSGQYELIAERLYNKIKLIDYVPFQTTKMGDPCLEVGDRVAVHTQENVTFASYIFNKHTSGIRGSFEDIQANGTRTLSRYEVAKTKSEKKLKNLDNRVGNIEKSGSGPLQIVSVRELPDNPQLNVLYLIQGEVTVS